MIASLIMLDILSLTVIVFAVYVIGGRLTRVIETLTVTTEKFAEAASGFTAEIHRERMPNTNGLPVTANQK